MQPSSTRFAAALAGPHEIAVRVTVQPALSGTVLDTLPITTGSVTEDSMQAIRRTGTFNFPDLTGEYVPASPTDLLHPDSGNELHVARGITFPDGTTELIPLGVFGLTKPTSTDTVNGLSLQLGGSDRSHVIARAGWVDPYPIAAGGNLLWQSIELAINNRWPGLTYNLTPTTDLVPDGVVLGLNSSPDPWKEIFGLSTSIGQEVLFDPQGVVVSRAQPVRKTVPDLRFTEGVGGTVVQVVRDLDGDRGYNGVIVTAQVVAGSPPIRSVVWFTADGSQPVPARPYFYTSPTITTQAQANIAAVGLLRSLVGAAEEVTFTAVPDPRLDAGDTITLTRLRSKVASNFIVQAITMPLDLTSPMQVTCVARQGQ